MITTVLFDLFGTLIELQRDSKPYHKIARQAPFAERDELLRKSMLHSCNSLTDYCKLIGVSVPENIEGLEEELKRDIEGAELFEDSLPALSQLKELGIKIGLISNLAAPYKKPVQALGIEKYFDVIVFSCDVGVAKPAPSIFQLALEQLGSSPAETIMVGDSYKSDVEGSSKIGVRGIQLVRNGAQNRPNEISELCRIMRKVYK